MTEEKKVTFSPVGGTAGEKIDIALGEITIRVTFTDLCNHVKGALEFNSKDIQQHYLGNRLIK